MDDTENARGAAIKRLNAKRAFRVSLFAYILVNSFLVILWALGERGVFWPIWPIAGWGLAIGFQAWNVYGARPTSEADIRREMQRDSGP